MIFFKKNSSGHESVLAKTRESDDAERSFDCMIFFFTQFDKTSHLHERVAGNCVSSFSNEPFAREGLRKCLVPVFAAKGV